MRYASLFRQCCSSQNRRSNDCPKVVLANASIIQVSADYHADLYRALRGGGSNFGVVTRFDVDTYAQGPMWGGMHVWSHTADMAAALTKAFTDFAYAAPLEPHASLFVGQGYRAGNYAYAAGLYNAAGTAFPPIFRAFETGEPFVRAKIASTARVTMLSDLAEELDQSEPPGMRSRFTTATFKADTELQRRIIEIYMEEVEATLEEGLSEDERFAPMMGFQPLTVNFLQQSQKRGGNIMGLETEDAPLMGEYLRISLFGAFLRKLL